MTLDEAQVQEALDSLRRAGAVALIQGDGRVEKFRHLLYDWLGVDKAELAVMTELLLRGAQTLGELRGRAARMEPIKDVGELQPIVDRLRQKGLVIYLTPPGRGGVVTHNLYQPQELAKLKNEHSGGESVQVPGPAGAPPRPASPAPSPVMSRDPHSPPSTYRADVAPIATKALAMNDLQELRAEIAALTRELAEVREESESRVRELRRELDHLKSQFGA
jgi:uncharacterized protein YceH (UPF0502 family)